MATDLTPKTGEIPIELKTAGYITTALFGLFLVVHFGVSLPDAIRRGREGVKRTREAPCQVLRPAPNNPKLGTLPQPAPEIELPTHDGRTLKLSSLRGRVVLVNFWATWCHTCVIEMPSLEELTLKMQGKPFTTLAVSVDQSWDEVRAFFPKGTAMTVVLDKNKDTAARYGTEKFPESYLIDAEGNVRYFIISERQNWQTSDVISCIEALAE